MTKLHNQQQVAPQSRGGEVMVQSSIKAGIYRHYKGHEYHVLGVGKIEATLEDVVIYEPLDTQSLIPFWVRPIADFVADVTVNGAKQPRFQWLRES